MAENNNKWSLYLIFGIPLIGILMTTAYYFYITGEGIKLDTINKGILITPPKQITQIPLQTPEGSAYEWQQTGNRWTFLVAGTADCNEACQKKMYLVRQIHTAIGKEAPRINMAYLNIERKLGSDTASLFAREYAQFTILHADEIQATALFSGKEPVLDILQSANFYVVDPSGWIMMYYTDAQDYRAVIKDMKFLLKNS